MNAPVHEAVDPAAAAPPPSVLVIEDDPVQRRFLCRLLSRAGVVSVTEAEDGDRALELSAQARDPFEIAICDLNMPKMDGMALLSRLAQMETAPAIVLSSAQNAGLIYAVELMARELDLDVLGVLPKPPQFEHLQTLLRARRAPRRRGPVRNAIEVGADEVARALAVGEFVPFFQPKVRLSDGLASGAEILVRWPHALHGLVSPATFLPLVEELDGFTALTFGLLDKAIPVLRDARRRLPDFKLALNVEASSLGDRAFCEALTRMVRAQDCEPSWFTLEITEGQALGKLALALEQIARLRMQGFGLSIDDFGTGYSSLQQLSRLPFSELKLDRSFVHGAHNTASKRIMVDTSVELSRRMGMSAVAEGVEDQADLDIVRAAGFDEVQGYIFARPMAATEFLSWLERPALTG